MAKKTKVNTESKGRTCPLEDYLDPKVLKRIRKSRGKTLQDMADLFGINVMSYRRYEEVGVSRMTLGVYRLRKICSYLDVNAVELFELFKYDPFENNLLKRFKRSCQKIKQDPNEVLTAMMLGFVTEIEDQ